MSENLRRSARLAGKKTEEILSGPPEGYIYSKGQGLVFKSGGNNVIGLADEDVKAGSESILVVFLEESGSETRYTAGETETIQLKDVIYPLKLRKDGNYYRITKKQLFEIGNYFEPESEDNVSEAEIPVKRSESRPGKSTVKKPKKTKVLSAYKKGVGNPNIKAFDTNPLLYDPSPIPDFSMSIRLSNLIFHRAAVTYNQELLMNLVKSVHKISNINESWGPECEITSLERAILAENKEFITTVFKELRNKQIKRAYMPQNGLTSVETGEVCIQAYGVRTRKVQMSRGGREGNNALIYNSPYTDDFSYFSSEPFLKRLIFKGASAEILTFLITLNPSIENSLGMCIGESIRSGNHKLSHHLIAHYNKNGGYGLNFLHQEVLEDKELTPFKKPSITKKPIENYLVSPFHTACINENTEHLKKLLSNCDDINYMDSEGRKAVHYAAACSSNQPLKLLQEYGCNLSDIDKMKITPLMISAMYGKTEPALFLLGNNVQFNYKSKDGKAAIHYAAENGHVEVFKVLINAGCKMDFVGIDRKTPLMFAAMNGHYEIVSEILKRGGKDTKKDKCRRSALIFAVKNGHTHIVSLLLSKGAPFDEPDSSKNFPIHYAAAYGWLDCLKLLLQAGADKNACNDWKLQPLLISLLQNQIGCFNHLKEEEDIDVNCKDEQGRTLVSRAVSMLNSSNYEQLEYLIVVKKADLNIPDLKGYTPLHYLCCISRPICPFSDISLKEIKEWEDKARKIQVKALELLIEYGSDINAVNTEGWSAYYYAIRGKNIHLFEVLVKKNADLTIGSSGGGIFHLLPTFELDVLSLCDKLLDNQELVEKFLKSQDEQGFTPILKFIEYFAGNYLNRNNVLNSEFTRDMQVEINKKNLIIKEELEKKKALEEEEKAKKALVSGNTDQLETPIIGQNLSGFLFGQTSNQSGSLFGQTFSQPGSLNAYLSPSTTPYLTLDYSLIYQKTQQALEKECDYYLYILNKMIQKGANIHDIVGKLKQYRENPLTYELTSNYFVDFDLTKRLKEYGSKGLQSALHLLGSCTYQKLFDFILSHNIDLNHQDFSRNSAILYFFINNNQAFVNRLIDLGADINIPNAIGEVLIQKCVESNNTVMIDQLIKIGANLNTQVSQGRTLLNIAIEMKNIHLVRKLLENGADPNFADKENRTALHIAFNQAEPTANASFDMEALLLLYKADINAKDSLLRTPLHYCFIKISSQNNNAQIDPIESVSSACALKLIDVNIQDQFRRTPLHYAAQCAALTSTMFLLSKGAQLEIEDINGNTPLAIAIRYGHCNYAIMLVQQSADVNKIVNVESYDYNSNYGYNYNYGYGYNNSGRFLQMGTYSMFKAAIIQEWQGLAYLLIFNGYPYMLAMQDAMTQNKFQLVKTLLVKVADNSQLQQVNSEGQNLFHSLAIYGNQAGHEITAIICEQLIEREVNMHIIDKYGRSPLHYAVKSGYNYLITILLEKSVSFKDVDIDGYSPIGYAIYSSKILSCLQTVTLFASYKADFFFRIVENGVTVTPLLHAIKSKANRSIIKFFLDHGASLQETDSLGQNSFIYAVLQEDLELVSALIFEGTLNLKQADTSGKTALIYAVLNNNIEIVKAIINSKGANVSQSDNEGNDALHYAVQPVPYGSYENEELVRILLELHPNPLTPNYRGETILSLAERQHSGKLLKVINAYLYKTYNMPEHHLIERKPSFYENNEDEIDFSKDAEEYVNLQSDIQNINLVERKVDSNGGFPQYYIVVDDFDLMMTKVDLSYGPYSAYVFYRMQLLKDTNREVFVLFTRWGRIGETGAFQRTPFSEYDEAVKEFSKIFKAKTGNEWGEAFVKKVGKYSPMKYAKTRVRFRDFITEFTHEIVPKSELPLKLLEAVEDFTSNNMFRGYFSQLSVDVNVMNFSNLSKDAINEAEQVLYSIAKAAKIFESENETDKKIELIGEIQNLTSRYYELIPIIHDDNSAIPPIIEESAIKANIDKIFLLKDIEIASKVILGALHRERVCNPYDYIVKSLRVNLEVLEESSDEFQLLLKYAQSGGYGYKNLSIFKVKRKGEYERIQEFKEISNRKLLWHGTKSANVTSILLQGLKIAPPEVPNTGFMFGKGVYFADVFNKSFGYCNDFGGKSSFMFLCEVVLGNMYELASSCYIDKLPEGFLSTKGLGRQIPNPRCSLFTPYGVEVPCGNLITEECKLGYYGLGYNEFIVYNTSQIRIRYLLHIKNN